MSFILAEAQPGHDAAEVCAAIESRTGLMALTRDQFFWKTINYFLGSTGIPVNFGITITLGFIIGAVITGQTFYLFTLENLKQFGALKAMGVTNGRLVGMILLQALVVGVMGYGLGIGLTAVFFTATGGITHLAGLYLTAHAAIGVAIAVLAIIGLTALISIRRVIVLEPAIVFRG
jgi:putative ABC transport system permease protein